MLKDELVNNKIRFLNTSDGKNVKKILEPFKIDQKHVFKYLADTFDPIISDTIGKSSFVDTGIRIEQKDAQRSSFIYTILLPMMGIKDLKTRFLEKSIYEGLFLTYDVNIDNFDINLMSFSLEKLLEWIDIFRGIVTSKFNDIFRKEMAKISSLKEPFIYISAESSTFLMGLIKGNDIFNLIEVVLAILNGNNPELLNNFDFKES